MQRMHSDPSSIHQSIYKFSFQIETALPLACATDFSIAHLSMLRSSKSQSNDRSERTGSYDGLRHQDKSISITCVQSDLGQSSERQCLTPMSSERLTVTGRWF